MQVPNTVYSYKKTIGIPKALKFTGCQFKTIVFPACEERKKYPEE